MSRHLYLKVLLRSAAFSGTLIVAAQPRDAGEIVRRAEIAFQKDWASAPDYAFLQRDESQQNGKQTSKTHRVVMIAGSDYYMPVAVDDRPLSFDQQQSEFQKLRAEVQRRGIEDPQARQRRSSTYRKQREQNGELITQYPNSFNFEILREETIDGHEAYLLEATPRKRPGSSNRTARILAGMRGRMWIDKETFHVIRAEANVITPVSVFGIFARVLAGTEFELEMAPVTDSIWLARRFSMTLVVSKLWLRSTQVVHSTYSDYRRNDVVLEELLSKAGGSGAAEALAAHI